MSDDVFRMIVAVGVAIAALSFVVQAIVGMIVLGVTRKMEAKISALADRADPAIETWRATVEKAGAAFAHVTPLIEQVRPAVASLGPTLQKVSGLLTSAQEMVDETRPRIREVSSEVVEIAKSGRETVEKVGEFLNDASGMAKTRLEQIDATVGSTVESVEQVSQNMKRAVTRPVREVNGLAAGVAAAVSTFVKGPRRSSVDSATQDEEMFI